MDLINVSPQNYFLGVLTDSTIVRSHVICRMCKHIKEIIL